jgi:hypothetical protein
MNVFASQQVAHGLVSSSLHWGALEGRACKSGPVLHNMSSPPRTSIHRAMRPVFGLTVISLARLLQRHGLEIPHEKKAAQKWAGGKSLTTLWRELACLSVSHRTATTAAESFEGVFIGWPRYVFPAPIWCYETSNIDLEEWVDATKEPSRFKPKLCLDAALTVGLLTRRSGALCLPQRSPEYTFEFLLAYEFFVDDPRLKPFTKEPK